MAVHPVIFEPILKPRIWGGTGLATLLGKKVPADEQIGESWEIADLDAGQSMVARGPARGRTLADLVHGWGSDLIGRASMADGRFPLLIKFLDASEVLSVQVHPDRAAADRFGGGARAKDEAWYIVHAEPGAYIYRGVRPGVDREVLRQAVAEHRIGSVLQRIPVKVGEAYFLPAGTVHAIGPGLVLAEVQTPSDTTYRLYDWDRVDPATGRPRDLHVDQALECASLDPVPAEAERREHVASVWTAITRLIQSDWFVIERVRMVEGVAQEIAHQEMVIWIVLEGRGSIAYEGAGSPLSFGVGDTVLLPAALRGGRVQTDSRCMWLEVTVPIPSDLADFSRPARERAGISGPPDGGVVRLTLAERPLSAPNDPDAPPPR